MEAYYDFCETGQVKLPPRGSERSASLLRRPPLSEYLQVKESTVAAHKPNHVRAQTLMYAAGSDVELGGCHGSGRSVLFS